MATKLRELAELLEVLAELEAVMAKLEARFTELRALLLLVQQRILALEADSIIQGTPRVYADYLEEEGEEP